MPEKSENFIDGWFHERNDQWAGQAWGLQVDEVLFDDVSPYQHVVVFRNKGPWGNVLVLDGCVQLTDKAEFTYHELMSHPPLFAHPNPKKVLIIGGGDGGVLREVVKHDCVEECHLVDIDQMVIDVSRKYFPQISCAFTHPKARVVVGDGFAFLENKCNEFDVIIVDSSDPDGPASSLFGKDFYQRMYNALRPGGIICTQALSMWLHTGFVRSMIRFVKEDIGFQHVKYGAALIPFYPTGTLGCIVACKGDHDVSAGPCRDIPEDLQATLQYYNKKMHPSIFCLPHSIDKELTL